MGTPGTTVGRVNLPTGGARCQQASIPIPTTPVTRAQAPAIVTDAFYRR
jgi:hypothetical protein